MQRNRNMRRGISMRKYMSSRGNNTSYNRVILTSGNVGSDVEKLQKMLVTISQDYNSIPVVNITSNYDDLTRRAVFELQKIMGLETTGSVNKIMWDRMNVLTSKRVEENFVDDTSFDESKNVISEGKKGKMVSDLQKYLNTITEKNPSIPKLTVDGIFGPKTKISVIAFQKLFNLEPDGIVGQITWETLYNISLGKKAPTIYD